MRRLIIGMLIGASMSGTAAIAAQDSPRATVAQGFGSRVVVRGCDAEDSCRIGYHANGNWTITRDRRH